MAWLHTWAGLIVSWVLFAIFLGGTLACFDKELDYWMRPALHRIAPGPVAMDAAAATLREMAPHAETLYLNPPSTRNPSIHGFVFEPGKPTIDVALNPRDGTLIPPTVGGNFFFVLHYNLQAGTPGAYLVGLAGMLMLLALVTGVIIHRRVFKDFFVFRPQAGGQRAWLDGHNLTGVLGLPFHLMIAYTGVIIMVSTYMTAGVQIAYRGNLAAYYEALSGTPHPVEQHRPPGQVASLDKVLDDAVQRLRGPVQYLEIEHVHDASIAISALESGNDEVAGGRRTLIYDGTDGHFRGESASPPAAYRTYQFLSGLHRVQFGGAAIRWLYFLLGAAGCVMLATAAQVWIEKRQRQAEKAGLRSGYGLVRRLSVAVIAGMPLASVALLWANRLLPDNLTARAAWEAQSFYAVWLLAAIWAVLRLRRGKPWRELFGMTAALLLALPLLNALTEPRSSLPASIANHHWVLAGIDASAFALGLGFAWLAWLSARPPKSLRRDARIPAASASSHADRPLEKSA
ncbi:PepSY-associated TM helix domain-containing protein [Rhodanobacter sp. BL-MT-08]